MVCADQYCLVIYQLFKLNQFRFKWVLKKNPTKITLQTVLPWHPWGLHDSVSMFSRRLHLPLRNHFKEQQYFSKETADFLWEIHQTQVSKCTHFAIHNASAITKPPHFVPFLTATSTIRFFCEGRQWWNINISNIKPDNTDCPHSVFFWRAIGSTPE